MTQSLPMMYLVSEYILEKAERGLTVTSFHAEQRNGADVRPVVCTGTIPPIITEMQGHKNETECL